MLLKIDVIKGDKLRRIHLVNRQFPLLRPLSYPAPKPTEANTEMRGERQPPSAASATVSKVLDDDDLRVGFPTTLVRAALVCKRWLWHASDPAFLRRFRELHPPRLLGFYIQGRYYQSVPPRFVPMLPQPAELAPVVRRASFSLDAYKRLSVTATIHDCRNGSVLITLYGRGLSGSFEVHCPLHPKRRMAYIPPLPDHKPHGVVHAFDQVLSKEGDGMSYFYLYVESWSTVGTVKPECRVHLHMLQDGSWLPRHPLVIDQLPHPLSKPRAVLVDSKIYMPAGPSDIIVLDVMASSFSTIQLPQGVEHGKVGTTMLARAHDASGVYLIHVGEFQLRIWLHKGGNWSLMDTICLREMCANLRKSGCTIKDEHLVFLVNQVVDYGDFVFLQMGGCVLLLDIKCRTLRTVYKTRNHYFGDIHPFMMIWPPTFPELKYDPARNAT